MRGATDALKHDRMAPLAREPGWLLADAIAQLAAEAPKEMLVVPEPLHRMPMAQRGFSQARTLAAEALRILRKSHPEWRLERSSSSLERSRESQAGLTPRQRRLNLRGAFFVSDSEAVRGRQILLVDDIFTMGATARACSRTLIEVGAASVRVATVARAQRRVPLQIRDDSNCVRLSLPDEDTGDRFPSKTITVH
jgi:predicted amidophosphoribosyltransferase